jgi:hypothetical protein
LYSGDIDKVIWNVNDANEKSHKVNEIYKYVVKDDGKYVVTAK